MRLWCRHFFICLGAASIVAPFTAAHPGTKEIDRLVKDLGSEVFEIRQSAKKRLEAIGQPALDALYKATTEDVLEVRRRAEAIAGLIENKLFGPDQVLPFSMVNPRLVCIDVSPDGRHLLITNDIDLDGSGRVGRAWLGLWDTYTGKKLREFEGHSSMITSVAFAPDGRHALSSSEDKTVRQWNVQTGKETRKWVHGSPVTGVVFGQDGKAISVAGAIHLLDLYSGKMGSLGYKFASCGERVVYSANSQLAMTSQHSPRSIRFWNLETGQERRRIQGDPGRYKFDLQCSPDGTRLVWTDGDQYFDKASRRYKYLEHGTLVVSDVATGEELMRIGAAHPGCVAFSPDGKRIASGSNDDYSVRVWDSVTGKELDRYLGHTEEVCDVAYFPNGKRIASASSDGTVHLWRRAGTR